MAGRIPEPRFPLTIKAEAYEAELQAEGVTNARRNPAPAASQGIADIGIFDRHPEDQGY